MKFGFPNQLKALLDWKDLHAKELLKGSSVAFIFKIIGMVSSYAFTVLIARNYGADTLGMFILAVTVMQIFSVTGKFGFDTAMLRFVAEYSSQNRWDMVKSVYVKAMRITIPVSVILAVTLFLSAPYIANYFFSKEPLGVYLRILSLAILPTVMISINSECLRGIKKIRSFLFLQNISISIFPFMVLTFFLLFPSQKYYYVPVSYMSGLIIVSFLSVYLWLRDYNSYDSLSFTQEVSYNSLLSVSVPMLLSSSMQLILGWADTVMLGIFRTEAEVGIFNVALKVSALTSLTLVAINSIAAPKFAELFGKNAMTEVGEVAQKSTKLIFWSSFPLLCILVLFPTLILGMFGMEFTEGRHALLFLIVGQFVNAISGSVGYILQMTGRESVLQRIIMVSTLMNIALNLVLIPRYGINGAALSSCISMIFWNVASVIYIYRAYGFLTIYIPLLRIR